MEKPNWGNVRCYKKLIIVRLNHTANNEKNAISNRSQLTSTFYSLSTHVFVAGYFFVDGVLYFALASCPSTVLFLFITRAVAQIAASSRD